MGARDALYLLERMGLRVRMSGAGTVVQQSLPEGHYLIKGERIHLKLQSQSEKKKTEPVRSDSLIKVLHKDSIRPQGILPENTGKKVQATGSPKTEKLHSKKNN